MTEDGPEEPLPPSSCVEPCSSKYSRKAMKCLVHEMRHMRQRVKVRDAAPATTTHVNIIYIHVAITRL
jgi:hypothetical protein